MDYGEEAKNVKIIKTHQISYTRKEILLGILKVFLITLAITAIVPIILTILYLDKYWGQIKADTYPVDIYREVPAFYEFGMLLSNIITIIIPLTTATTIGKGLLYTKLDKAYVILIILAITVVLFFVMAFIGNVLVRWATSW